MMKTKTGIFGLLLLLTMSASAQQEGVTRYVNPFIGTGKVDDNSLKGGNFPGAAMPFGMVQLSPDEFVRPNGDEASGYDYSRDTIYGFSHTHLSGTGCVDLLDVLVQPSVKPVATLTGQETFPETFSHAREQARVGYYAVRYDGSDILTELTATVRTGMTRITFPAGKPRNLIFDMAHAGQNRGGDRKTIIFNSQLRLLDSTTLVGYRKLSGWQKERSVYFYAKFSCPVTDAIFKSGKEVFLKGDVANGRNTKCFLSFSSTSEPLLVKVALSPVSVENARLNMEKENPSWNFDTIAKDAETAWEKELSNIRIDGTDEQKAIFYTGLYHAYIQPNTISDANGDYVRSDYTVARLPEGDTQYSTFSLWDTFRACNPLYTLLKPERVGDFVKSMLRQYEVYGYLPIWQLWGSENYCMIGNHAIPVVVDAALKGLPGVNRAKVYEAVRGSSLRDHPQSPWSMLEKYGYLPEPKQIESVSITLENAYDDACVARLAKALGKTEDYDYFNRRAHFYRNLYDARTGFFRAKDEQDNWMEPFNSYSYKPVGMHPYAEGNAWQYRFFVLQDVPDLVNLMGGKRKFEQALDALFTDETRVDLDGGGNASGFIGQYAHGNEPSHHCAYLYNWCGADRKAQYYANKVMTEQYNARHDGYSGNEDCGQMSAWYVWSSMGFYPVDPASGIYSFGSPQFRKVEITLPGGRTFTVKSNRKGKEDCYIKAVRLNGKAYKKNYITHADILRGGELEFVMGK
ncbi:GH92 family glycosyl hydrolase [Prevotella sp. KH2C16]|uniref:GH92 family glycosyl hydrolase n=1 Tax=Prevotella sp. KH2C16 TaxID=1855325 RepID=UPI00210164F3|nr:GH92 family glycosyl hydrolase [Prevotella sp. KH2C16]